MIVIIIYSNLYVLYLCYFISFWQYPYEALQLGQIKSIVTWKFDLISKFNKLRCLTQESQNLSTFMQNKFVFKQLPPDPPRRRSQRIATRSMKKNPPTTPHPLPPASSSPASSTHQIHLKKRTTPTPTLPLRPTSLTSNLFASLYNNPIRIRGCFQIIEWRKKRQGIYSVRLTDGFFRIKAFAKGQVAKQLAKNQIKQFYILKCAIDYQGDKICELKMIDTYYEYGFSVGFTQAWKFDKLNHNPLGSSVIQWDKWDKFVRYQREKEKEVGSGKEKEKGRGEEAEEKREKQMEREKEKEKANNDDTEVDDDTKTITESKNERFGNQKTIDVKRQEIPEKNLANESKQSKFTFAPPPQPKQQIKVEPKIEHNPLTKPPHQPYISPKQQKKQPHPPKPQTIRKKLLLIDKKDSQASQQSIDTPFNTKLQKIESLNFERTQSLKIQDGERNEGEKLANNDDDSWDNFLDDFVVFSSSHNVAKNKGLGGTDQKTTKVQQSDTNPNKTQQRLKLQLQTKRQMIFQLLQDSDSDRPSSPHPPQSSTRPKSLLLTKESQTFSPQPIRNKEFINTINSFFEEESQTMVRMDSRLPAVRSVKKEVGQVRKEEVLVRGRVEERKVEKFSLRMVSKELSAVKREEEKEKKCNLTRSIFEEIMMEVDEQFEQKRTSQEKHSQTKAKAYGPSHTKAPSHIITTPNHNPNQVLTPTKPKTKPHPSPPPRSPSTPHSSSPTSPHKKLYQIKDLITLSTSQNFFFFKQQILSSTWFLRVKLLYLQTQQQARDQKEKSTYLKSHPITKSNVDSLLKAVAVSENHEHMCTMLIAKDAIDKYRLKQNELYIIESPRIILANHSDDQVAIHPQNMLAPWVEVGVQNRVTHGAGNTNRQNMAVSQQQREPWLDEIFHIEFKEDKDAMNVVGYVSSVLVNDASVKTEGTKVNDESSNNSTYYSKKNFTNNTKKFKDPRPIATLQIIDPFKGYAIDVAIFTPLPPNLSPNTPITIFRAQATITKHKRSLSTKAQTIVIYGRFVSTPTIQKVEQFHLANEGNLERVLANLQVQLVGYKEAHNLFHASCQQQNTKIHVKECTIFSVKKIAYLGCKYCQKKVFEGSCPNCGPCKKDDIFEKVMFVGELFDDSGSLKFFLDKSVADQALERSDRAVKIQVETSFVSQNSKDNNGRNPFEQCQQTEDMLALQRVSVWFVYQGEDKPLSLNKISIVKSGPPIQQMLDYIQSGL